MAYDRLRGIVQKKLRADQQLLTQTSLPDYKVLVTDQFSEEYANVSVDPPAA